MVRMLLIMASILLAGDNYRVHSKSASLMMRQLGPAAGGRGNFAPLAGYSSLNINRDGFIADDDNSDNDDDYNTSFRDCDSLLCRY